MALLLALAPPATAQEPEPEPEPTTPVLPDPDPAPAPPKPARPAPAKPAPRASPTPRYVAPEVALVAPVRQARSVPAAPARTKPKARANRAVSKPAATIRHLPVRDSSIVRLSETALVLAAEGEGGGGGDFSATALVAGLWLGLAGALLLIAWATPYVALPAPLNDRRGQLALMGANMFVVAGLGYFVVAATS